MKNRCTLLLLALALLFFQNTLTAQQQPPAQMPGYGSVTPKQMWEVGLHAGVPFILGDIEFQPNWGAGLHVRRALDYLFSVRGDLFVSQLKNSDNVDGATETDFKAGSLQIVVSLNNLKWTPTDRRRINLYAFAGGGVNRFSVVAKTIIQPELHSTGNLTQSHLDAGFGFSYRLSERFNLGLETKAYVPFGRDADLLDGIAREEHDIVSYTNLRLNINLGNTDKRSEPLYWVNPLDGIMQDVTELKMRPVYDFTDTDGDGVIDLLDQDSATPEGAQVDTRGRALDSDNDGIPNQEDEEPYFPEGAKPALQGQKPYMNEDDVEKIVERKMNKYERSNGGRTGKSGRTGSSGEPGDPSVAADGQENITNWFLPMIHFDIDQHKVRKSEHGNLSSIAKLMKSNTDLKIVATGFTDKTASENYNRDLSFRRAKTAIDFLVKEHGLARSRFILNYNGEDDPLVPSAGSTLMNRRVEFREADETDLDMDPPRPLVSKEDSGGQ